VRYFFEDYAFDTDRRELHRGEALYLIRLRRPRQDAPSTSFFRG
jgi:hypothetical protein